jgi:acetyl-CoA carboxylase alpha subunit
MIDTQGAALSQQAEKGALAGEIARCLADLVTLEAHHPVSPAGASHRGAP